MLIQIELFYLFYTIQQILSNIHTTLFCRPVLFIFLFSIKQNEIRMR